PPLCRTPLGRSAGSPRTPPEAGHRPGSDVISHLRHVLGGLLSFAFLAPTSPHSWCDFPQRSPPRPLCRRSLRWFETSPCRAIPADLPPSPVQHRLQLTRLLRGQPWR